MIEAFYNLVAILVCNSTGEMNRWNGTLTSPRECKHETNTQDNHVKVNHILDGILYTILGLISFDRWMYKGHVLPTVDLGYNITT